METVDLQQVLYRAASDPRFALSGFAKLRSNEDTFAEYKDIASAINYHYHTYKTPISKTALLTALKIQLKKAGKLTDESSMELGHQVQDIFNLSSSENYSNDKEISQQIDTWCRNQVVVDIMKANILRDNDFGNTKVVTEMVEELKDALTIGSTDSLFDTIDVTGGNKDDLINYLKHISKDVIPTGWSHLDDLFGGGLARGEVGLIIGRSGGGKSTLMINLSTQYLSVQKKNILYIALEEVKERMYYKMLTNITRKKRSDLYSQGNDLNEAEAGALIDKVRELSEKGIIGSTLLKRANPNEVSPQDIEQLIQEYQADRGVPPDVVLVDYPDLMRNPYLTKNMNEYSAIGHLYEDLRRIAGKYNLLMWVASQSNRGAINSDVLRAEDIEGGIQKRNAVDAILTVNQTSEEWNAGFIRLYADKIRNVSDKTNDLMTWLKVNPSGIRLLDETPEEHKAHEEVVASHQSQFSGYSKKRALDPQKSFEEAQRKVTEANKRN